MEENAAENKPSKKEQNRRWIFKDFVRSGVRFALALSVIIFALYTIGSLPDPGFSDRILFLLLRMLRYVSLINCAFSLFAMGYAVHRLVYQPSFRNVIGLFFYFGTAILGAGLVLFGSLMFAATEGNV